MLLNLSASAYYWPSEYKNYVALGVPPASLMETQAHARETRALPGHRPRNSFSCVTGCATAHEKLLRKYLNPEARSADSG